VCTTTCEQTEFLTVADLCERYHCSCVPILQRIQNHNFPQPIKFDVGVGIRRRWRRSEVEAWEAEWMAPRLGCA